MSCPPADTLLLDELGELPVNRREAVRAHVDGCRRCLAERTALRTMMADLRPSPAGANANDDGPLFSAKVLAAARSMPQAPRAIPRHGRARAAFFAAALAAAVVAALWLVPRHGAGVRPPISDETEQPIAGTLTARGGPSSGERLSAEILLVRDGRLLPLAGRAMRKSDALAVRVTNLSGSDMHVMAFAWDAAGDVHWLYPAYLDERTNPRSVPVAAGSKPRLLGDVVQPDAPHAGPLRLVTLFAVSPLTVKDVEARLAQTPAQQRGTAEMSRALFRRDRARMVRALGGRTVTKRQSARWFATAIRALGVAAVVGRPARGEGARPPRRRSSPSSSPTIAAPVSIARICSTPMTTGLATTSCFAVSPPPRRSGC